MRLITWNVNSLRARLPRVRELLAAHRPDVVCLQETKVTAEQFPHDALRDEGYLAVDHSGGRWNGVALLVPEDRSVEDVCCGLADEPEATEARWIEGTVDGVRVVSVYVPNGRAPDDPTFPAKLDFLDAARDRAATLAATGPTVIAGDLNVAPEDRDVWDPAQFVGATHVTPDERERVAAIGATGYQDAFRTVAPDAPGFTWWDYRMGAFRRGWGMRIDLALVSDHLTVASCEVDTVFRRVNADGDKPSDHAPLVVELELPFG